DAAGNVRPVGAIEAVGDGGGARADAGSKRGGVFARVHAEDEIQGVEHVVGADDVWKRTVEKVLLEAETLNLPSGAPDVRTIRDAEGRGGLRFHHFREALFDGSADLVDERFVGEQI